jgi:predicted GNAT family N-acyltransferase
MFHVACSMDEFLKVLIVRGIVFIEEQNCPYDAEVDEHEYRAIHILGEEDGEPIAAARITFAGDQAKLERIAVRKAYRGRNLGHELVEYMLQVAREHGFHKFKMHAQADLCGYYARHGFEVRGEMFQEAGIDHYLMVREDSPGERQVQSGDREEP